MNNELNNNNKTEGSNTMSNELNEDIDWKKEYEKLLGGMLGMSISGIKRNCHQYGSQYTMMFMSDKQRKRKTYDRGIIDGRLEFIDELECWIVSEIGKKEISEHYKSHNIEYTDGEVK